MALYVFYNLFKKGKFMTEIQNSISRQAAALKGKTENEEEKIIPYSSIKEYVSDIFAMFMRHRTADNLQALDRIENRLKITSIKIPFENYIRKLKLNRAEKLVLFNAVYKKLADNRILDRQDIFSYLTDNNICAAGEAISVFGENYSLINKGCLEKQRSGLKLTKKAEKAFLSFMTRGKKKPYKKTSLMPESMSPVELNEQLGRYIIGQDEARQILCTAVYEHSLRSRLKAKGRKTDKNNTLIIGPTGTGKTYMCSVLAEILGVPFYAADASQLTEQGYVGLGVESILKGLQARIPGMANRFPPSIIYIDEIDKIRERPGNGRSNGIGERSIQEELLKMLESDTYCTFSSKITGDNVHEYDISEVMFIAGGAFSGLEEILRKKHGYCRKSIGFIDENSMENQSKGAENTRSPFTGVSADDLKEYGFMQEFIGRFSRIITLNALTEDDLVRIMSESRGNALEQYMEIYREAGMELEFSPEELRKIAREAIRKGTGARGIKNTLCHILGQTLYECSAKGKKSCAV